MNTMANTRTLGRITPMYRTNAVVSSLTQAQRRELFLGYVWPTAMSIKWGGYPLLKPIHSQPAAAPCLRCSVDIGGLRAIVQPAVRRGKGVRATLLTPSPIPLYKLCFEATTCNTRPPMLAPPVMCPAAASG